MSKSKSKKPDYRLCVLDKATGRYSDVGVGWVADNGRISIKLNVCTVLDDSEELVISLFPMGELDQKLQKVKDEYFSKKENLPS